MNAFQTATALITGRFRDSRGEKPGSFTRLVSNERGLTLVEIIVVLVILAILMNFLFSNLIGSGEGAKAKINDIKMQKLKNAISQFQLQYNQLPQDLNALTSCAGVTGQSCVPVLSDQDSIADVWGTPYQYRVEGGRSFTIRTLGADRKDGGTGADGDVVLKGP
jgi:general secretion pathway protein G